MTKKFYSYEEITQKAFKRFLEELKEYKLNSDDLWSSAYSADSFVTFCGVRANLLPMLCTELNGNYSNIARVIITDDYEYTADIDVRTFKDKDGEYLQLVANNSESINDLKTCLLLEVINKDIRHMHF